MARTIAANAAYPSVGHIPLRRELDDATGMGADHRRQGTDSVSIQGRHCLFRCGAERAACLAHSPRTGITKEGPFSFKPRAHQRFGSLVPIDAADQCDTGSQISSERVPCFAVQYSTSPQKRSKEGGRALSVEAPLGMSMEMLTFDTNLGGYRTDITEQQIRGAPAFSRDQTSTNVEAFA